MATTFLNISNHPSGRWSAKQKDKAMEYGEIMDWVFPMIGSAWSHENVEELADSYLRKVKSLASPEEVVIHIMGELTFCFSLISKLKSEGYLCVASTSERRVVEKNDGVKEVTFEFERFREY